MLSFFRCPFRQNDGEKYNKLIYDVLHFAITRDDVFRMSLTNELITIISPRPRETWVSLHVQNVLVWPSAPSCCERKDPGAPWTFAKFDVAVKYTGVQRLQVYNRTRTSLQKKLASPQTMPLLGPTRICGFGWWLPQKRAILFFLSHSQRTKRKKEEKIPCHLSGRSYTPS